MMRVITTHVVVILVVIVNVCVQLLVHMLMCAVIEAFISSGGRSIYVQSNAKSVKNIKLVET
jgi:hypothetical protein